MDENLKREIILDNYQNPENKKLIDDDSYLKVNQASESCIDNLDFMMKIENNTIVDVRYDGEACAISTSASSIMSRALIGRSVDDAKRILINYKNMIEDKEYDKELLGELNVYDNINKQPNRIKCALLPEEAINKMLGGLENE
jgi:nitrogen fixation NifU-like protein